MLMELYTTGKEDDDAQIFIPSYQREFIWPPKKQSRFIESLFMGLPVPPLFMGKTDDDEHVGGLEVIDGTQRLRTLNYFMSDRLRLADMEKIPALNGFIYSELPKRLQRDFRIKAIRVAVLNTNLDADSRREMFDRLNTGGVELKAMEKRRGHSDGKFLAMLHKLAENQKLRILCPLSEKRQAFREYEEMILRFFAYGDDAQSFEHAVAPFLDVYLKTMNERFEQNPELEVKYVQRLCGMLDFVEKYFPYGFKKGPAFKSVPRVRFEAISVGVDWALRENVALVPPAVAGWLASKEFKEHTTTDGANSRPKILERIWFVRDNLLGREPETYSRQKEVASNSVDADGSDWSTLSLF